jgi:hypothetical protein
VSETEKVLDESFDATRFPKEQIERDVTSQPGEIREKPYDIDAEQDKVRGRLAQGLFVLLSITVLATLGLLGADHINGQAAGIVLSPIVALTGTAIGFYFGGRVGGKPRSN